MDAEFFQSLKKSFNTREKFAPVMGLSNYQCKLLSPVLTHYGMDKGGKAKLLRDMNRGETFNCSVLADRAFLIEPDHVSTVGYGKDRSGSLIYLQDTLEKIKKANSNKECLIPVHVDGDGHCLVHAVSRALVGRELFWHALRENLKLNFKQNLDRYKEMLRDFIDVTEWEDIINECDPNFTPPEGMPPGLRNIHIFGLANVLHRPIILLDSINGMKNCADYSATFLPGLLDGDSCKGKDGKFNKPICIAWSSSGHNHFIPLVGIKNTVLPTLPAELLPKAWGISQDQIGKYIQFEQDGGCVIGGDRSLSDDYLMRLANAMNEVFMDKHSGIHPSLVAEYHHNTYNGTIEVKPEEVIEKVQRYVLEQRLYRCIKCWMINTCPYPAESLAPGGIYYKMLKAKYGRLEPRKYILWHDCVTVEFVAMYNQERNSLVVDVECLQCRHCEEYAVREVHPDGSVVYINGDRTRAQGKTGFKYYYDGNEYDNEPLKIPIKLEWAGRCVREAVTWFYNDTNVLLNSNVYNVALELVTKHFPGEFGSETLVQNVVNQLLIYSKNMTDCAEFRSLFLQLLSGP